MEGNRFDLIQSAKMKVQMVVDEEPDAPPVEVRGILGLSSLSGSVVI